MLGPPGKSITPKIISINCYLYIRFQLILGDYFKVYVFAAEIAEKATGLIGWLNGHGKVRKIFDAAQKDISQDRQGRAVVLAYLVANLTRWTTHFVAFNWLHDVKDALQLAVITKRNAIISAQVGASKSTEKQRLEAEANQWCHVIADRGFWHGLETVIGDLEPICYGTNINQTDSTRPDQVLLTLAGLYLHFVDHPEPEVSQHMVKRLEKRWKDCEQPVFLLALILNPFEGLSCFGPDANLNHFKCNSILVSVSTCVLVRFGLSSLQLYCRMVERPENQDIAQVRKQKEQALSKAFLHYLAASSHFPCWKDEREEFEKMMVWINFCLSSILNKFQLD